VRRSNTEVIGLMYLPKHEITDKKRATAQMIAASHQMYQFQSACRFEWKMCMEKTTYTLNRDIVWQRQYTELALNFKSNGSRRICAIFLGMQFMIIATMSAKGYGIF
jgi:hypothetical protein